jgi:hypothetical protein
VGRWQGLIEQETALKRAEALKSREGEENRKVNLHKIIHKNWRNPQAGQGGSGSRPAILALAKERAQKVLKAPSVATL